MIEKNVRHKLMESWKPIIEHKDLAPIQDNYRKVVTSILLENQKNFLAEDAHANAAGGPLGSSAASTGAVAGYDPIIIGLVRRAMPNLIAFDLCGVQPMTGPTGLIFAMKSTYTSQNGTEALFNEANTAFTGDASTAHSGTDPVLSSNTGQVGYSTSTDIDTVVGSPMGVSDAERLGMGGSGDGDFNEMAFTIEKVSVTANTRALKAEYTTELAQDLKSVHGLDAEAELANILAAEILAEINREVVRKINITAKIGCTANTVTNAGTFDLDIDSNGRWSVEKFKGLLFQIEREANKIAKETRRGKGNFILCSADVASALGMAGVLNYDAALNGTNSLNVDDTGNTFVGVLNGRIKVYIDPYHNSLTGLEYVNVGYRGQNPYDAGLFYCPYVPLQMVRAIGENSFQPKIAFKTRYGMVANPFVSAGVGTIGIHNNMYYRIFAVKNLM